MESFCWALPGKQEHSPSHAISAPGHATQQQLLHVCKAPQAHSMVIIAICPLLPAWGWAMLRAGRWWQGRCSSISSTGQHSPGDTRKNMHTCLSAHVCAHEQVLWHCSSSSAQTGSGEGRASFSPSPIHQHRREGVVTCVGCGADMDYINLYFCHSLFPGKKRECKINPDPLCGVPCLKQSLWQSHSLTAAL